jgi:hypothetical protein
LSVPPNISSCFSRFGEPSGNGDGRLIGRRRRQPTTVIAMPGAMPVIVAELPDG